MALRSKVDAVSESDSGLTETGLNLSKEWDAKAELVHVPIDDVRPPKNNSRQLRLTLESLRAPETIEDPAMREEADYIRDLSMTIRDHGQLQPGLGYRAGTGIVELMAGERRWWACQLAGLDEMQVMVYPEKPRGNATRHLIENVHRRNLSPAGVLRGILSIMDEQEASGDPITTGRKLQQTIRLPKTVAYRWWAIVNGPSDLRDGVLSGLVPNPSIAELLGKMDDEERQKRISTQSFDDLERNKQVAQPKPLQPAGTAGDITKPNKGGRPATHVNMGRCDNGDVVRHMIETLDPNGDYDHVDWSNLNQVGEVWRGLLKRINQRYE